MPNFITRRAQNWQEPPKMTPTSHTGPRLPNSCRQRRTNLLTTARYLLVQARAEGIDISNDALLPLQHEVEHALRAERQARTRDNQGRVSGVNGTNQVSGARLEEILAQEVGISGDSDIYVDMDVDVEILEDGEVLESEGAQTRDIEIEDGSPATGVGFFDPTGTYVRIPGSNSSLFRAVPSILRPVSRANVFAHESYLGTLICLNETMLTH
jgi:hypothetical protein